jgi:putative FmdB family regulatory protein
MVKQSTQRALINSHKGNIMPIYEYKCQECSAVTTVFTRSIHSDISAICEKCNSNQLMRIFSKFSVSKNIQQVHDSNPINQSTSSNFYNDPRNIGRNVEKNFSDWNMEIPSSIKESIDAAREGTMPKELDL